MNRRLARENTFILIFESIFKQDEVAEEIFTKATEIRGLEYDDYVKKIFFGSYENSSVIDAAVEKHLVGWRSERISPVSRALIRLAAYEIMFVEDIPAKVSINEAVELSKKYDDEKSYSFVNGVLNALSAEYAR
ncbi:MAG: transcription antitermination factor NusB [Clostridia bacterium]|nr:transcription antitermination factor NusB [Clostridia bacterium]